MTRYLEIAVNFPQAGQQSPTGGIFHYHLPSELEGQVQKGSLVTVPFGSRTVQGVVLGFVGQPVVSETRPVLDIVDPAVALTEYQIMLAERIARDYLAPLATCIGLMLPPGLDQQADNLYSLKVKSAENLGVVQSRLLDLLAKRGSLRGRQIDRAMPRANWRLAARTLVRRGILATQPVLTDPKVRPKMVRTAQLACPPQVALEQLPSLGKSGSKSLERRQAILRFLVRDPGPVDVSWIYAESDGNWSDLRFLSDRGLVALGGSEVQRDPLTQIDLQFTRPMILTADQQVVWEEVHRQLSSKLGAPAAPDGLQGDLSENRLYTNKPILLHGVTGSGKTEIYLQAVQDVLAQGKQAIILVPEIALTPQTIRRFAGRFPGQVGLIHSGLSLGERYDTWRRAKAGAINLVVGPRSALFTPFSRLGLIVVDECHDDSYYQSEIIPYYHAREVAIVLSQLTGAVCLLGSATPDLSSTYRCKQGEWIYLALPSRILAHHEAVQAQIQSLSKSMPLSTRDRAPTSAQSHYRSLEAQVDAIDLPPVTVIDMRQELKAGNRSIFSKSLSEALDEVLSQKLQAILFLNRRGAATYVFCRDCGNTLKCPRCDVPLTYHLDKDERTFNQPDLGVLRCHYCNYHRNMPRTCPNCQSTRIRHYGTGTQRVEAEVQAEFPQARTLRWDYETTRAKGAHDVIMSHFVAHRADVLIGTQMLAKGLDLPLVTLVGVVLADVGLNLPDYRANERTFQILTQVAGRAGRSPLGGKVILQTFQPDHYVIKSAARHDYQAFYRQEMEFRRRLNYPPYTNLVRLETSKTDSARVEQLANETALRIQEWLSEEGHGETRMIGPAPCFFARQGGMYRWQIILVGADPASVLRGRRLDDWKIEVNSPSLL
jgi:primosomal protein N' (replication factor Y) (superfamily II helicase)